jgi:hypothetical protein
MLGKQLGSPKHLHCSKHSYTCTVRIANPSMHMD